MACVVAFGPYVIAAGGPLGGLIDAVLRRGPDGRLPAHLSRVLGVSGADGTTAVKQAVIRDGDVIRTFNVCRENHRDVVILTYDGRTQITKAYLVSTAGAMRKAVDYHGGEPARERSATEAHSDLIRELEFWADLAGRSAQSPGIP